MTAATAGTSRRGARGGLVVGGLVAAVLLLAAVVAGQGSSSSGGALSPTSTSPDGLHGLVLLVERFGGTVTTNAAVPPDGVRVALLTSDRLDDATRREIADWVEGGGTLVVTDPASELSALAAEAPAGPVLVRGTCTSPGFEGVDRLDASAPAGTDLDPVAASYVVGPNDTSCFGATARAFVVETPRGAGRIVSVGSPNPLVNGRLAEADNSVFALRLVQPDGPATVAVLQGRAGGTTTLLDLVPERVVQAIVQLGVAYLLYVLYRARRLGRPVVEPQPVEIPGSRMVSAVGHLQARSHASARAAHAMRSDVRRAISTHYGLPVRAPASTVAGAVAGRTGLDAERVARALDDTPVLDDDQLVAVTHELDTIRTEVLHGSRR